MRLTMRLLVLALLAAPAAGAAQEKKKYKVLFVTQSKGFMHGSVRRKAPDQLAPAEVSVTEVGKDSGLFDVECTQDASVLTPEKLKELDVVIFYTTGALPVTPEHFTAFLEWLKGGKAFVGVHSATDTFSSYKPYYELINGAFDGHPWGSGETVTITNHEPDHAVTKMWEAEFQIKDEIYQYRLYDLKSVRVLQSLNMAKCRTKGPYHVPVCWVREYGKGRMFYTNLGHNEGTWQNSTFKQHLLAGIRWALKLEDGPAAPNPEVQAAESAKAFLAVAGPDTGKNVDDLLARLAKASAAETARLVPLYGDFQALRRIKDAGKKKAEIARLAAEIEKALGP